MDKKRKSDKGRKSYHTFKKRRSQLKKTKLQTTTSQERREGVTYQSGVGIASDVQSQVTKETAPSTEKQFESYVEEKGSNLNTEEIATNIN